MPFLSGVAIDICTEILTRATDPSPVGLTSGINEVDEMLGGGFVRQQLSYLVGDSGVGKSWLASSWVLNAAKHLHEGDDSRPRTGYRVSEVSDTKLMKVRQDVANKENKLPIIVFWSLEMAEFPLVVRMISQLTALYSEGKQGIDSAMLLRGTFGVGGLDKDNPVVQRLSNVGNMLNMYGSHIYMDFDSRTVQQFRGVLDELVQTYDVCMCVIDYFRLIDEIAYDGNMSTLQAERSKSLKEVAREYDCHVLSLFDITREGQKAGMVNVNQMKGGTAAQYDADLVLTLWEYPEEKHMPVAKKTEKHLVLSVGMGRYVATSKVDLLMTMATGHVTVWDHRTSGIKDYNSGGYDGERDV